MEQAITINQILAVMGIIVAIAAFISASMALYKYITDAHDRAQKWDEYDQQIKAVKDEQCMLTYCMMATLDGLNQLGANGKVTEAKNKLDKYINEKAHDHK